MAPRAASLLDVGCGTGQHLRHLSQHFHAEGLDLSPDMLEIARQRCPQILFHEGSLVDFRIPGRFDVVTCLFGSIAYAATVDNLHRAVRCMAAHLGPGGALIVEPWVALDRFVSDRLVFDHVDDPDLKAARIYVTRRQGDMAILESEYLIGTAQGVTRFTERQELGLFTDDDYRRAFREASLDVVDASGDLFGYGLYVCRATGVSRVEKGYSGPSIARTDA